MSTPKSKDNMKKGPWTRDEDQKLLAFIQQHGHGSWRTLPQKAGLERCGKSCRLRWTNYLRPDIKRGKFSSHEEKSIIRLHALLGNRWSVIAAHLPNRTDNEIKNYWNTRLKKRLTRMGIDPTTHKPKNNQAGKHGASVSHMAQWETARLEAEARLARLSNLQRANVPFPPPYLRSCCFFNSTPTSTLNFSSSNNVTVPTLKENDVVEMRGKMENSLPVQNDDVIYARDVMIGSSSSYNHDYMGNLVGSVLEEYEERGDINYWNELLDLVNSSPTL